MEQILDVHNGVSGLLVSICVLLAVQLLLKAAEFLWGVVEKKENASEAAIKKLTDVLRENTLATQHLDKRINALEILLAELPKFKLDVKRLFSAIKMVAGDDWPSIKRGMLEDETDI